MDLTRLRRKDRAFQSDNHLGKTGLASMAGAEGGGGKIQGEGEIKQGFQEVYLFHRLNGRLLRRNFSCAEGWWYKEG